MTAASNAQESFTGHGGQAAQLVLVQPRALDVEYEWLGYEAAYPLTWIPSDWPAAPLLRSD